MSELLFEIGTEELPAGFQKPALAQLQQNFIAMARELDLSHGAVTTVGTPRRLALLVADLAGRQPDKSIEIIGPSRQAGVDADGNATPAAIGFARSKGADVAALKVVDTEKGEYLMLVQEIDGVETSVLLPDLLATLMGKFSFAKSMRWGAGTFTFARPVQWLLALYDGTVVPFVHEGITTTNRTRGHRFMANKEFTVLGITEYRKIMTDAFVQVDPDVRREAVLAEIENAVSKTLSPIDAHVAVDDALLNTVCNLVEKPHGVCGSFDEKFLQLPREALVTSMREHQKYFPVVDSRDTLLPYFVAVNNTCVKDIDLTRTGHERVLRARLEDAFFFFAGDKEKKLEARIDDLEGIIFQAKLGTILDKTGRIKKLVSMLAEQLAPEAGVDACRAAELCKTDLLTDMVGEFPSLQGNMGRAYALHDGENSEVAQGISEHYLPRRAGSALPESSVGALLGLADRFDTISGCFGIGQIPTGTKDPFGLRRIALAILHIVQAFQWKLSLSEVIAKTLSLYGNKVDASEKITKQIIAFIRDRFVNDQLAAGADPQAVEAVTSVSFNDINDCLLKIEALAAIRKEESFAVLAASFKRIRNIIKDNDTETNNIDSTLFTEDSEKELFAVYKQIQAQVQPMLGTGDYKASLLAMLNLKSPVDRFFEGVMVMDDDAAVRANRLNLLTAISELFLQVGDISKMN